MTLLHSKRKLSTQFVTEIFMPILGGEFSSHPGLLAEALNERRGRREHQSCVALSLGGIPPTAAHSVGLGVSLFCPLSNASLHLGSCLEHFNPHSVGTDVQNEQQFISIYHTIQCEMQRFHRVQVYQVHIMALTRVAIFVNQTESRIMWRTGFWAYVRDCLDCLGLREYAHRGWHHFPARILG